MVEFKYCQSLTRHSDENENEDCKYEIDYKFRRMIMKRSIVILGFALMLSISGLAPAATNFNNALGDNDFNNAANWDNGLPGSNPATPADINDSGSPDDRLAILTAKYLKPNGNFVLRVGGGTTGRLVIPTGILLETGNDVRIGRNAGGIGRLDLMGTLQVSGTGVDMFVGNADGTGTVIVYNGGFLDVRKRTLIQNGKLTYHPHVVPSATKDKVIVDNAGTLAFITEHADVGTIAGSTVAIELGSNSTLELLLTGDFDLNDSWTLIQGITTIGGVSDGDGTGVFGNVVSPQGFGFDIAYTPQSAAGAGDGTIVAALTSAVALPVIPPDIENVPVATTLEWKPGSIGPITGYDVYFGTDPNELSPNWFGNNKIVSKSLQTSYTPPAPLDYDTPHYWRVDVYESNPGGEDILHTGSVWSFTTEPPTPQILAHPQILQILAAGSTAEISIETLNGEFFQWFKEGDATPLANGGDISGADTDTLSIGNLEKADEGFYYCEVTNTLSPEKATSNSGRVMTQRMVAHWTFEDTLVDEVDGWQGRYIDPATGLEETPVYVDLIEDVNAIDGKAIEFFDDGKNVQIHDPADPDYFSFHHFGITVSCWIKTDVVNGGATMLSKQRSNAFDGWSLRNPNNPDFTIQRATEETVVGPESLTDGEWHMVTGQYDGRFLKLYVDATLVDVSEENVETLVLPGDALVIGANNADGGGSFDGLIDDVRVWNYAVDPLEIARIYSFMTGESVCTELIRLDLNGDCVVDEKDLMLFAGQWLRDNTVRPQL